MATEIVWVHGNSGQLQVIDSGWGKAYPHGAGLFLEGNVQDAGNQNEPWIQFHIPMTSLPVEGEPEPLVTTAMPPKIYRWPRLRAVMLQIATDSNPADPDPSYPPMGSDYYKRYKYITDTGGAIVTRLHLYDGYDRVFARDDLQWQSASTDLPEVRSLPLPDIEIRLGLGISVRVRFKNQMRLQMIEGTFQGQFGPNSEHVVADYEPEEDPTTRTDTKAAFLSSVGCEFVPAGP